MTAESVLRFAQYDLQTVALIWMALLYGLKIYQMWRLPMPWEQAPARGSPVRGVLASYMTVIFPWLMESSRQHLWRWAEFAVYHLGAAAAILATFAIPFAPGLLVLPLRYVLAAVTVAAVLLGLVKIVRRFWSPALRLVSTPDDYFSLVALEVFFAATVAVLLADGTATRIAFFVITAAFLFYVPFSKISHYVYYFMAGIFTGARYGFRGVRPSTRRAG
jgi:hypothetical protein